MGFTPAVYYNQALFEAGVHITSYGTDDFDKQFVAPENWSAQFKSELIK